jgi:hypothetical protein
MRFGILFGLVAACGFAAAATNPQKWSFRTGPAPHVTVSTVSGNITAVAGDNDNVGVEGTATGNWVLEVKQDGDEVRARACCGPCNAQHNHDCNGDASFVVRIPPGAQLAASAVSGNLRVSGLRGHHQLNTVSGDVAWEGVCAKDCRVHANTVSGDIKMDLSQQSSFGLEYGSVSGSFKDDLATNVSDRGRSHVRATYGKAEGQISCNTVSGDLALGRK